jgi:hypothetical protein
MSDCSTPSAAHLRAGQLIGLIALAFAEFECEIDACLQTMAGSASLITRRMLRKLNFNHKLDTLHCALAHCHEGDDKRLASLHRWRGRFERFRARRNDVVHGIWDEASQSVHVQQDPDREASRKVRRRFDVHQLSSELDALRQFRTSTAQYWLGLQTAL